ncbi:unnamed protein product [Owenia fusiformis]|uniref:Succinate dehydrogenase assembly factor 4, mitochondrial n=1 Tax=Owenia fusiformis TaxID=6347 RepID=A0A8J1XTN4_OWEFU|nr:unnamed protein product [Owenia fusiformis]
MSCAVRRAVKDGCLFRRIFKRCSASQYSYSPLSQHSTDAKKGKLKKATTPTGKLDDPFENDKEKQAPQTMTTPAFEPFPENRNPETGEIDGPKGPEPTRYGDWERKGRVTDF